MAHVKWLVSSLSQQLSLLQVDTTECPNFHPFLSYFFLSAVEMDRMDELCFRITDAKGFCAENCLLHCWCLELFLYLFYCYRKYFTLQYHPTSFSIRSCEKFTETDFVLAVRHSFLRNLAGWRAAYAACAGQGVLWPWNESQSLI